MYKAALLKDLRKQVAALEDDLRARTDSVEEYRADLDREYRAAREANRTAATYEAWRDERVTQAAAAWVLATVFVRFCEDNGLIEDAFITGPGERFADAEDRQGAFFRERPELNDRDWLLAAFEHLAGTHPAVAGLFDSGHNALYALGPSYEAVTRLLGFWRERGPDGEIVHDFTDKELDTRFLGDLYQDLSEHARKTYALLQTPEFVEEFILDLTLEPAVDEFGLDPAWKHKPSGWQGDDPVVRGLRCIDPACGSGHFLLGMFERLLAKWREAEPGTGDWELVRRSLESVHGCDKNPFAVAIARFRLLVAVLRVCGERRLASVPEFPINVAVGDSLLHGRGAETITETLDTLFGDEDRTFAYRTEDVWEFADRVDLLGRGSYHVVVGNPPYITVKDKQERVNYKVYRSSYREYALTAPFVERIFDLSIREDSRGGECGFTGQITANSFMGREFGKRLVEEFLPIVNLTHVIDTSGAHIPEHGTPTVILVGRNRLPKQDHPDPVRAVLGIRGEPGQPGVGEPGSVWSAIVEQLDQPGSQSEWVSVEDVPLARFVNHPWSLSGGGAGDLRVELEGGRGRLRQQIDGVGLAVVTGEDSAFATSRNAASLARGVPMQMGAEGTEVRDWGLQNPSWLLSAYAEDWNLRDLADLSPLVHELWPLRELLFERKKFSISLRERGAAWYEWREIYPSKLTAEILLAFPLVATHNHFYMEKERVALKHSISVVKLPEDATEEQHLELLGVLNSSTACFWLKQVSHNKGSSVDSRGARTTSVPWDDFYEFTGTKLQEFPLPSNLPIEFAQQLDFLAKELAGFEPSAVTAVSSTTRASLDRARCMHQSIRAHMIGLQEELDWTVYGLYDLLTSDEVARTTLPSGMEVPEVALGERAFEIVLARKVAAGDVETAWFERHRSTPATEIPSHWPDEYKAVIQARIDIINTRSDIALIERPECKRRWASEPWEKKEKEALRTWLLDRCENEELWFGMRDGFRAPRTLTVSQLADELRKDEDVQAVAELYATDHMDKRDAPLATVLAEIIATEHVPYLAAMRYRDTGLRKRAQWEQVWDLQREEDRTGKRLDVAVPPKYSSADFLKHTYWSHRGKLDVPKERFISYPDASPDADPTLLLGWAGWDHKDQVQALVNVINDRTDQAGWSTARLTPLIAGIQELMPWVHQWHGEQDEEWDGIPAEEYQAYLDEQRGKHGLSADDLTAWRPEKKTRGRAKATN